jgi:hypothetical protein
MATLAATPTSGSHSYAWPIRHVERTASGVTEGAAQIAYERWRSRSSLLCNVCGGTTQSPTPMAANLWDDPPSAVTDPMGGSARRGLVASGGFLAASVALSLGALGSSVPELFVTSAGLAAVASYAFFTRWLARQQPASGILYQLERVRRAVAYEGDPGSRRE